MKSKLLNWMMVFVLFPALSARVQFPTQGQQNKQHIRYAVTEPQGVVPQAAAAHSLQQARSRVEERRAEQSQIATATSATKDSGPGDFLVQGYCYTGRTLTGSCIGPSSNHLTCQTASDVQQCPPGAKPKKPKRISLCGIGPQPVDLARPCAVSSSTDAHSPVRNFFDPEAEQFSLLVR
jgi:hypothetical protein